MHYVPEISLNLVRNARLQRWFKKEEVQDSIFQNHEDLIYPSIEFNLFYILLHTYRHFMYEGVGMRQLMDYYFVLNFDLDKDIKERAFYQIASFGMQRFASGVMWIMKHVFGLDDMYLLCESNEKEGLYILEKVMNGGNFGKHDERRAKKLKGKKGVVLNVLKHNWHLLLHYPSEVLWTPVYVVWHFCWKRCKTICDR